MMKKVVQIYYNLKNRPRLCISQIFEKISKSPVFYKGKVVISSETKPERKKINEGG